MMLVRIRQYLDTLYIHYYNSIYCVISNALNNITKSPCGDNFTFLNYDVSENFLLFHNVHHN